MTTPAAGTHDAGFEVAPAALTAFDAAASRLAETVRGLGEQTGRLYLPPEAFGRVRRSAAVQRAFLDVIENGADTLRACAEDVRAIAAGTHAGARSYTADDQGAAARFLGIPTA